jgi:hypothetical protein
MGLGLLVADLPQVQAQLLDAHPDFWYPFRLTPMNGREGQVGMFSGVLAFAV